jgi:hypothetical protein
LLSIGNWLSRETVLVGLVRLGKERQGERKNPEFCRGFFLRECYLFGGHKVVDFWIERERVIEIKIWFRFMGAKQYLFCFSS